MKAFQTRIRSLTAIGLCLQFSNVIGQQPVPTPSPQPKVESQQQKPATPQPSPLPQEDFDVVKITTNLVQIDAVVTDKKGNRVTDLRPDEVEMQEDGRTQKITNFSYVAIEPKPTVKSVPTPKSVDPLAAPLTSKPMPRPDEVKRTLALVVDDLGLSFESAYYVRRAVKKFVDEQVQPEDLVAIVRTAGGIGTLQQFTNDKRLLYAAADRVKWNPRGRGGISAVPAISGLAMEDHGQPEGEPARQTPEERMDEFREDLFAAGTLGALQYVVRGLSELPGRKSAILFSDGFRITSNDSLVNLRVMSALRNLVDQANRSAVVIYTIDARGLQTLGLTAADEVHPQIAMELASKRRALFHESQDGLVYLAENTGGFTIRNSNDLSNGVKRVLEDQAGYYLIGYRPDDSTFESYKGGTKFHNIKLKVKRPGDFTVRMRNGFYGITDEKRAAIQRTPEQQILHALASPFGASGVQLKLTSIFVNSSAGSLVHSFLHVKASDLTFTTEPDGTHKTSFDIVAISFGDNGRLVDQLGYTKQLVIKDKNFLNFLANGFVYNIRLPIKTAGGYQLRTAIRDRASLRIGSASQFVEVPDVKKDRLTMSGILMKGVPLSSYLKDVAAESDADNSVEQADPNANTAVRQFHTGLALLYGFGIYNARIDKLSRKPQLKTQVRVFRNGEPVFVGDEIPFDPRDQTDPKRFQVAGAIQLGTKMIPGEYILQILVTDMLAKEKQRVTSQWMSFDITK